MDGPGRGAGAATCMRRIWLKSRRTDPATSHDYVSTKKVVDLMSTNHILLFQASGILFLFRLHTINQTLTTHARTLTFITTRTQILPYKHLRRLSEQILKIEEVTIRLQALS